MSDEFKPGDAARCDGTHDVTVRFGPYRPLSGVGYAYLVENDSGGHKPVTATRLSRPTPSFAVGDVVKRPEQSGDDTFSLRAGPFTGRGTVWWAARRTFDEAEFPLDESTLTLVRRAEPPAPTVGDRVRVVNAPWVDQYNGRVGVISKVSSDPILTFGVKFADGDEVWATTVEPAVDSTPEVGDQVRVTVAGGASAWFLGKVGELAEIDLEDSEIPYRVEFPGDDTWSWVKGVEHA